MELFTKNPEYVEDDGQLTLILYSRLMFFYIM